MRYAICLIALLLSIKSFSDEYRNTVFAESFGKTVFWGNISYERYFRDVFCVGTETGVRMSCQTVTRSGYFDYDIFSGVFSDRRLL
jgi:hypothetical protein